MNQRNDQTDFIKAIGLRMKHFRRIKGITQRQMAKGCGMETASICKIELGKTNPRLRTLKVICDCMQISLPELFEGIQKVPSARHVVEKPTPSFVSLHVRPS